MPYSTAPAAAALTLLDRHPAPWSTEAASTSPVTGGSHFHYVLDANGKIVVNTWAGPDLEKAALIASAPDGLELARRFLDFARSGGHFAYPPGALQELEAFIAKAEARA